MRVCRYIYRVEVERPEIYLVHVFNRLRTAPARVKITDGGENGEETYVYDNTNSVQAAECSIIRIMDTCMQHVLL